MHVIDDSQPSIGTGTNDAVHHAGHVAIGTLQGFLASAISLPTGLLTAAFLTRRLGPENYGVLTVAATIIAWTAITVTTGFSRTAEKFVAQADSWESVSSRFVQIQLLVAILSAAAIAGIAPLVASWLKAPVLSRYLRLFSLDIPICALGTIHESILIGRGYFRQRALLRGAYWVIRMILIFLFVGLYSSVSSVILAMIGTSIAFLIGTRFFIKPPFLTRSDFAIRLLWDYAWPLFFFTVALNLFNGLDLLFVKAIVSPDVTGFYSAAKNLTIVPALFAASLSPLLLAKLSELQRNAQEESARLVTKHALRVVLWLLPFVGMAAGAASEVVVAIYGSPFLPAASFLVFLIFAALAIAMISVAASILVAAGRPGLPFSLTGPFVAIAPFVYFVFVSHFGATGAALATTGLTALSAIANMLAVCKICKLIPPGATLLRSTMATGIAYGTACLWPAPGFLLFIKLPAISLLILCAFFVAGEFNARDVDFVRATLRWRTVRN